MIHILVGEPLQRERALAALKGKFLQSATRDFNLEIVEGREFSAARCLAHCGQLPVLAASRVVIVLDADQIRKSELEQLEGREIPPSTELIFTAEKLDRRLRYWQKVRAGWKEFRTPYPREMPRWIAEEAGRKGLKLSPEATSWLAERFGTELALISSSLEKLSLAGKPKLQVEDLEEAICFSSFSNVFELTDAVGRGSLVKALRLYRQMTRSGESPVGLLALIARHFRILLKVKETGEGAPPYFLKNYQEQAGRFTPDQLYASIERIFQVDWNLKRSPLPPDLTMEKLLLELCDRRGESRDVPGGITAVEDPGGGGPAEQRVCR